jgi:hypothetical protein
VRSKRKIKKSQREGIKSTDWWVRKQEEKNNVQANEAKQRAASENLRRRTARKRGHEAHVDSKNVQAKRSCQNSKTVWKRLRDRGAEKASHEHTSARGHSRQNHSKRRKHRSTGVQKTTDAKDEGATY